MAFMLEKDSKSYHSSLSGQGMAMNRQSRALVVACALSTMILLFWNTLVADRDFLFRPAQGTIINTHVPGKDFKLLVSNRHPLGMVNVIDVDGLDAKPYNPTIIQLPHGAAHEYMVIVRLWPVSITIAVAETARKYSIFRQLAFFADLRTDPHTGIPYLKRSGQWSAVIQDGMPIPLSRCLRAQGRRSYVGPEDMRVFWTRDGAPLLVFTHQAVEEGGCQNTFVIDARKAIEPLSKALARGSNALPPIKFVQPWQLQRDNVSAEIREVDKNWEPFQTGFGEERDELYFSAQISEPRVYKYQDFKKYAQYVQSASDVSGPFSVAPIERTANMVSKPSRRLYADKKRLESVQDLNIIVKSDVQNTMISEPTMADESLDNLLAESDSAALETNDSKLTCFERFTGSDIHQATPILRVTLCDRGQCVPSVHNTVLFGLIHKSNRQPHLWYDRRIVTWNITAPFKQRSISKRLVYPGIRHDHYAWTGSMTYNFNASEIPKDRSHGFLDDEIWLGFGIRDLEAGWLDVDARQLLDDHYIC